jgi:hypothetical protein
MSLSFSDEEFSHMVSEEFSRYLDSPDGERKIERILNAYLSEKLVDGAQ